MTHRNTLVRRAQGGEAYLLPVTLPYSQVPHLLQFQIRLQYLLPNIDSGYISPTISFSIKLNGTTMGPNHEPEFY